jgi:hypothetical protein
MKNYFIFAAIFTLMSTNTFAQMETSKIHILLNANKGGICQVNIWSWGADVYSNGKQFQFKKDVTKSDGRLVAKSENSRMDDQTIEVNFSEDGSIYSLAISHKSIRDKMWDFKIELLNRMGLMISTIPARTTDVVCLSKRALD